MTEPTNRIQTVDGLQDMLLEAADLAGRLAECAREQDDRKAPETWKRGWTPTLETTEAMLRAQARLIDSVIGRSLKEVNWPEELDMAYTGSRDGDPAQVRISGRRAETKTLTLEHEIPRTRPGPFDWGKESTGAERLAMAILKDTCGEEDTSLKRYGQFQKEVIARLPEGEWRITKRQVWSWLRDHP